MTTIKDPIPFELRKEWDKYRTTFGGQIDPDFEALMAMKRTRRINAWFGQKSIREKR